MEIGYLSFLFLFLFLFIFSCSPQPASSRVLHNNLTDLESLLAFKASVSNPDGFLATNWTTDASFCSSWFGVECNNRSTQRVVKIDIRDASLQGTISPHLGNLSFLSYLNLGNNSLTGPVPPSIGRLPRLAVLRLHRNNLSGTIPFSIFNMTSLTMLDLSWNSLYGPLPSKKELFMLPRLEGISLASNYLTGTIPSHFARCSLLRIFGLAGNEFRGSIPPELGSLTRLERFYIGANYLTGKIPASLGNLTKLNELELAFNHLEGSIPEELGNLPVLEDLHLGNNSLTGSVPMNLLNASNLNFLDLGENKLTGVLPTTLGKNWPRLTVLDMPENQLTGGLDFLASVSNCRNLEVIELSSNKLDGIIPDSIGNLSDSLNYLGISNANIKGQIPTIIGNLSGLVYLLLNDNKLSGEVPSTLSQLKKLQGMSLGGNRIGGSLPVELDQMTSLNALDLSNNTLSGSIPYSLGNISTLQNVYLSANRLFSNIPDSLWNLSDLLILDLSKNNLEGLLSPLMENLKYLDKLDLSTNRLSDNISTSLGELQMLTYLNLSGNTLHGQIPTTVKKLINIEYMDLSHNDLSGSIPSSLANLKHLHSLNLSFNKFEGQIPRGGVFSNLSMLSLEGNVALCGALQLGFSPCPSNVMASSRSKSKPYLLKYILPPIAFSVILVFCFYVRFIYRRQRSGGKLELNTHLKEFKIISYNELVRATNNFSDANLLGRGSFGSVFKAYIDDGSIAAVKVLNLEDQASLRSFDIECRVLSMVRHRNLVKIINTCSNLDFKALVLEFMPNGNLEKWLYSHENYLNLHQRLNIMVDVSLGLEYLHHDHPDIIVHCDLKPSNVLLDENMIAHVSDFGISKILLGDSKSILSSSAPGTFGYMAPEYGSTGKASKRSDVYSFGILLLETLTRKKPSEAMFTGGLSLRQWISEAYPATVLEIVDPDLLIKDYSTQRQPDPLIIAHECLLSLIELGLQCSRNSPKERILMRDVVPILQKIRMKYLSESCSTGA